MIGKTPSFSLYLCFLLFSINPRVFRFKKKRDDSDELLSVVIVVKYQYMQFSSCGFKAIVSTAKNRPHAPL